MKKNLDLFRQMPYADAKSLEECFTLRNVCKEYINNTVYPHDKNQTYESSGRDGLTTMPCMNRFYNIIGNVDKDTTIIHKLVLHTSEYTFISVLTDLIAQAIDSGTLWNYHNLDLCKKQDNLWYVNDDIVDDYFNILLNKLSNLNYVPMSAHTTHAYLETQNVNLHTPMVDIYMLPRNATPSTGLLGTLHNNQLIDMAPNELPSEPSKRDRSFFDEYAGFICASHTSHSTDAGRVRRVTCGISIRLISNQMLESISAMSDVITISNESDSWTIYCMGHVVHVTEDTITKLSEQHAYDRRNNNTSYSLYISISNKLCVLCISPGNLIKRTTNNIFSDNIEYYKSDKFNKSFVPFIDTVGKDSTRSMFSAYYTLIPYIKSDRAPRPSISSAQTTQAVCLPWCPATATVSPCYTFTPLVYTELYSLVLRDIEDAYTETSLGNYLIGENISVLYLNLPDTYEDAIIVSQKYVDNGGFNTMSLCKYLISTSDAVPEVNQKMCSVVFIWWKGACEKGCLHTLEYTKSTSKFYRVGRIHTGVVTAVNFTDSGDYSITIRSFQQLQTGDKLTTGHGQKGVVKITDYIDMPIAHMDDGQTYIPDIVVAMSSIICRQTNGQLYETQHGLDVLKNNAFRIVGDNDTLDNFEEVYVTDGMTGKYFTTIDANENIIPTRASFGYVRVNNQTQMTREKHHTSSKSVGKHTAKTPVRRSRGGGVTLGEMEIQAALSSGLRNIVTELVNRGDIVSIPVCIVCKRLQVLCTCDVNTNTVDVNMPYETIVVDCTNAVVYGGSFEYDVAPNV
jgi:hypothetical protein